MDSSSILRHVAPEEGVVTERRSQANIGQAAPYGFPGNLQEPRVAYSFFPDPNRPHTAVDYYSQVVPHAHAPYLVPGTVLTCPSEPTIAEKAEAILLRIVQVVDAGDTIVISDPSRRGTNLHGDIELEPGETFDEFVARIYEERCVVRGRATR
jgi:hypothetical protein